MIATALVAAVGSAEHFARGRQMSASLGLTPKQHSSGNKDRLLGISKRGDSYLRSLLIHGVRAAVALANKTVRMPWAMLRHGTDYQPDRVTVNIR